MKNTMNTKNACKIGAVLVAGLYFSTASAQTWTGATDNAWETSTNWNTGTVPGATAANSPTINLDGAAVNLSSALANDLESSEGR